MDYMLTSGKHIYVGWNLKHMRHMKNLSTSSLAKHVKCVTVNTEILPALKKRRWLECLYKTETSEGRMEEVGVNPNLGRIYDILLRQYSEDTLEVAWKEFQNVAANQQLWGHYIGDLLGRVLQSLPKVEHLEFIDKRGMYNDQPGSIREPLALCSPWKSLSLCPFKYDDLLTMDWKVGDILPTEEDVSSAFALHHVADWNRARWPSGYTSITCVKELTIEFGHHIPVSEVFEATSCEPCDRCVWSTQRSAVFQNAFETFPNLDRVNIKVSGDQLQHEEAVCNEIVSALSKATNLRHLKIDNRNTDCDFLRAFVGRKPLWPLLEQLRLSGVTSRDHLMNFLCSTGESLRVLELVEIQLEEGSEMSIEQRPRWDDCLEKREQILYLERACVRSLCYQGSEKYTEYTVFFAATSGSISEMNKTVERFLTGRVEVLPRQETWDAILTCKSLASLY
jgi:hypothetical protein